MPDRMLFTVCVVVFIFGFSNIFAACRHSPRAYRKRKRKIEANRSRAVVVFIIHPDTHTTNARIQIHAELHLHAHTIVCMLKSVRLFKQKLAARLQPGQIICVCLPVCVLLSASVYRWICLFSLLCHSLGCRRLPINLLF